jgi:polar amino acid transport system substrate-binding protein
MFVALILLVALATTFMSAFAAGPVYKDLPDLEGREIRVAVENLYTPFQFENPSNGEVMGFEYDMLAEICARLNCVPVYEYISWDAMIPAVSEAQSSATPTSTLTNTCWCGPMRTASPPSMSSRRAKG